MKVAFLVNDLQLSGGIGVVVEHARRLAHDHGFDVTLVLVREHEAPTWSYEALADVHIVPLHEVAAERYDVAVATWWETTWGAGAFAELRSLLPPEAAVARQLQLEGSLVVAEDGPAGAHATVEVPAADALPTHFIAALGPDAGRLGLHAAVAATDLDERRRAERQRDADVAFLEAENAMLRAKLRAAGGAA